MIDTFLVPEHTDITAAGEGASVQIDAAQQRHFLFTLIIEKIVEQESLDVLILGSEDGNTWLPKPLGAFPQSFYPTEKNLLLDLRGQPTIRYLKAKWLANRWGVGSHQPYFRFHVRLREVPAELIAERKGSGQRHASA